MKNVLLSILIIISLFCLYFRYFILKNIKYKEVMLVKNFFNENELENLKTADNIKFYRNTVENIKNKLKRIKKLIILILGIFVGVLLLKIMMDGPIIRILNPYLINL